VKRQISAKAMWYYWYSVLRRKRRSVGTPVTTDAMRNFQEFLRITAHTR